MKSNINFSHLLLISCLLTITGCQNVIDLSVASPEVIKISEVKNEQLLQNSLTVQGTVEKVIPLLDSSVYLLKDETELIWVLTNNEPPRKLESVTIEAMLKNEKIVIDGEEYSEYYLQEVDRQLLETNP
jgi:hypothetical protein